MENSDEALIVTLTRYVRHPDQEVLVSWTKNLVRLNLPIFHFLDDVFVVTWTELCSSTCWTKF